MYNWFNEIMYEIIETINGSGQTNNKEWLKSMLDVIYMFLKLSLQWLRDLDINWDLLALHFA